MKILNHIAIEVTDKNQAEIFFTKILNIPKIGSFTISSKLCKDIFGISKKIEIRIFANDDIKLEVFTTHKKAPHSYSHICLNVKNKKNIIDKCKKYGIIPNIVKKDDRELLFIKDFSGNLFEIKEIS